MKCMACEKSFSESDALMILRDNDIPLCDSCSLGAIEVQIGYDGSIDLFDYLKEHTPKTRICGSCLSNSVELMSIRFGNPIEGQVQCKVCKVEDEIDIYLEMI